MLENIQHEIVMTKMSPQELSYLPPQLIYNNEKISSITPYIKEIIYSPNTGLSYNDGDTIRFLLNSTGFIDPYCTKLLFTMTSRDESVIDSSMHSLISSLIISSNGNIIEEINDYDVINSIIIDSTFNTGMKSLYKSWGIESFTSDNMDVHGFNIPGRNCVEGKLNCDDITANQLSYTVKKLPGTQSFSIPLMSNIFGLGLNLQNYKWLPLELFPNLEFTIVLNKNLLYGIDRRYVLSNVRLSTSQLFFDSSVLRLIREHSLKNGFSIETQVIQSFQQKRFSHVIPQAYVIHVPRKSIRSVMTLFLKTDYENTPQRKKLNRYSRHVTRFQVKIGDDYFPFNPLQGMSSTSFGQQNCTPFLMELNNIFFRNGLNFADTEIDVINYASDADYYNGVIRTQNGRCVYGVCLDMIPMSGGIYKSGIDTRFTKPIILEINCDTQLCVSGDFCQYVLLEYDYTLKINLNGFITKDF